MNRALYVVLWGFEILAIVALVLALVLRIHDYALILLALVFALLLTGLLRKYHRKIGGMGRKYPQK